MNIKRDLINVTIIYVLALIYSIFVRETAGIVFFILVLYLVTIFLYINTQKRLDEDKELSLGSVLQRLDKTQKENEETYKRFLSLSKTLGSGVFMVDDEGKIFFANKDIENYFSINFNGLDYNEIAFVKPLYKFVNKAYLTEETQRKQIKYEEHYYDLTATPLFENDIFSGTLILVHDITQLRTAEKLQKQFTADVSHELRTPLSAIKGFSEILSRDDEMDTKDQKEFLSLIKKEADRMDVILNDLLVISKLDRIDYDMEFQDLPIENVINDAISLLRQKAIDKGLTITTNIEDCILPIDSSKINQVLLNMIKNAINYTDEGFIHIESKIEDDYYTINIIDTGIGIPKGKEELIFKRFYRVDKARSRDTGGSGLGLAISKNVILKHGGEISVHQNQDKGSTFTIKLPLKNKN